MPNLTHMYRTISQVVTAVSLHSRLTNDTDQMASLKDSLPKIEVVNTDETQLVADINWFDKPDQRVRRTHYGRNQDYKRERQQEYEDRRKFLEKYGNNWDNVPICLPSSLPYTNALSDIANSCLVFREDYSKAEPQYSIPDRGIPSTSAHFIKPQLDDLLFQVLLDKTKPGSEDARLLGRLYQEVQCHDRYLNQDQTELLGRLLIKLNPTANDFINTAFRLDQVLQSSDNGSPRPT